MTHHDIITLAAVERTSAERKESRRVADAAEAEHHAAMMDRQRERYAAAAERNADPERAAAANEIFKAAAVFERDAKRTPSRIKKAIEAVRLAVFMLDPKAPA